jgi:hypothetical protein
MHCGKIALGVLVSILSTKLKGYVIGQSSKHILVSEIFCYTSMSLHTSFAQINIYLLFFLTDIRWLTKLACLIFIIRTETVSCYELNYFILSFLHSIWIRLVWMSIMLGFLENDIFDAMVNLIKDKRNINNSQSCGIVVCIHIPYYLCEQVRSRSSWKLSPTFEVTFLWHLA